MKNYFWICLFCTTLTDALQYTLIYKTTQLFDCSNQTIVQYKYITQVNDGPLIFSQHFV